MSTHVIPSPEPLNPDCGSAATEQLRNVMAGQKAEIAALRAELATLKREARESVSNPARQAILTRYVCPTNFRGGRIKAYCERGSVTISYPDEANQGQEAHEVAFRALLAKFAKEDGASRSWPAPEQWVCGALPQSARDAFVFVINPSPVP